MLTRRDFLACGLTTLGVCFELTYPAQSLAKKKKIIEDGPHRLSRQAWPPAILPDFMELDSRGYAYLLDQFGRMSVVDFRKAGRSSRPGDSPEVVAELTGLGKSIKGLTISGSIGFIVSKSASSDPDNNGKSEFLLTAIDLKKPAEPQVCGKCNIDKLDSFSGLAAERNTIVVCGVSTSKEEIALIYDAKSKSEIKQASSITSEFPIVDACLEKRELILLSTDNKKSRLEFYKVTQPTAPAKTSSLDIGAALSTLVRDTNSLYLIGSGDNTQDLDANSKTGEKSENSSSNNASNKNASAEIADNKKSSEKLVAYSISLKPAPHAISTTPVERISKLLDARMGKKQLLLTGRDEDDRLILNSLAVDKHNNLASDQVLIIPTGARGTVERAGLIERKGILYLSCGWSGIQVLSNKTKKWEIAYSYKIPRLAAAGIATWGNDAVLVSGELMRYDIADPERPILVESAPLTSPVRSMVGAGSFILTLSNEQLTLRRMSSLEQIVASCAVRGRDLTFDRSEHRAYVIEPMEKLTRIHPLKVFSDNLEKLQYFEIPGNFYHGKAGSGHLVLTDINDVMLLKVSEKVKQIGKRHLENLAVRDTVLTDGHLLATAIDAKQKGFLLIMDREDKNLAILGSIDLPHNCVSLSAKGNTAVTVGKSENGKDLISFLDITLPAAPRLIKTMDALEAASMVTIQSELAIVAGRGLEILNL